MSKLVLLSGWAHPVASLAPLLDALRPKLAVDAVCLSELIGPGVSGDPVAVLDPHLAGQGEKFLLAGWSTGGMIALDYAARHPDRISKLVLISSTARFTQTDDYPCGVDAGEVRAMAEGLRAAPETTLAGFFRRGVMPHRLPRARCDALVTAALGLGVDHLLAGLDYLLTADHRDLFPLIRVPTLILHGDRDAVIPLAAAEYMAERIPESRLVVHAGIGHDPPLRKTGDSILVFTGMRREEGLDLIRVRSAAGRGEEPEERPARRVMGDPEEQKEDDERPGR